MVTIRDVRAIVTAPAGLNLIVVKVETSEPGLYGLGCATFAYRHKAVVSMIEDYVKPLLVGRDVSRTAVLARRSRADVRPVGRRHGALGHQGQDGGNAGLPAPRRQVP